MDDMTFDRLTRRLMLSGLVGGSLLGLLVGSDAAAGQGSRRKRCKKKGRKFCAGRCCPKQQICVTKTCVPTCDKPLECPPVGGTELCGANRQCLCTRTLAGKAFCASTPLFCNEAPACDANTPCPAGTFCTTCACVEGGAPDFRCFAPCPEM
jgi:hypothetical protein